MIARPDVASIRHHYDKLSSLYCGFWGEHIHHGYWENGETPAKAQENLVRELARRAEIPTGAHVLDVGCGVGGSSLWLAKNLGCNVLGLTLSPVQAAMAAKKAQDAKLDHKISFKVFDANHLQNLTERFDVVWVIECSEHIFDKENFIKNCSALLKAHGRLGLCAWTASEDLSLGRKYDLIREVCEGMLCPSLAKISEYLNWMDKSGFQTINADDLTDKTARTWEICRGILEQPQIKALLHFSSPKVRRFASAFKATQSAYKEGAMSYALFTARKPGEPK